MVAVTGEGHIFTILIGGAIDEQMVYVFLIFQLVGTVLLRIAPLPLPSVLCFENDSERITA
jgi:ABC-type long-subunit fatty acid transport system fused permease/ATPase subunit